MLLIPADDGALCHVAGVRRRALPLAPKKPSWQGPQSRSHTHWSKALQARWRHQLPQQCKSLRVENFMYIVPCQAQDDRMRFRFTLHYKDGDHEALVPRTNVTALVQSRGVLHMPPGNPILLARMRRAGSTHSTLVPGIHVSRSSHMAGAIVVWQTTIMYTVALRPAEGWLYSMHSES